MSVPDSVSDREVIIGGGLHAAVYAATRVAMGKEVPIVLEERSELGGVFATLIPFAMNSANDASVASVEAGPSRLIRKSQSDDINYLPNSRFQVRDRNYGAEYPSSADMAYVIKKTLSDYAETYTSAYVNVARTSLEVYADDSIERDDASRDYLGAARRIIYATGLRMPDTYEGLTTRSVMTAENFLRNPILDYENKRVAIVGAGDTAATIAEFLVGQGITRPFTRPDNIDWYGGPYMSLTKKRWALDYHARYIGLARHFPEAKRAGVIKPIRERGIINPLGSVTEVNGRTYDLVIDATGFKPYKPFNVNINEVYRASTNTRVIARTDYDGRFVIGAAADLSPFLEPAYQNRFIASNSALYNLAPLTATLAAVLD